MKACVTTANSIDNTQRKESEASAELLDIDTCLRRSAQQHPAQLALADSRQQLTWAKLDRQLNRVANALIGIGIQPNERMAILGLNAYSD